MPVIKIRDIMVNFPYEAYEIQKDYMEKVLECLQNSKNGVLESPTGTGKTLSLLCSSLAWLSTQRAALQLKAQGKLCSENQFISEMKENLNSVTGAQSSSWGDGIFRPPKVVYASRTHSQLNQVMLELKKTAYKHLKVGVLGSRDQLCIHPQVSKEINVGAKINMCKMLISSKSCHFYNNVENRVKDPVFQEDRLVDIEDLVKKGKQTQCCPYFASRELQNDADILFTPYNYLLDPKTRKSHDIRLANDIILLDEGHNVEKVCEESTSSQLTSTTVAVCIQEITKVMKIFHSEVDKDFGLFDGNLPKDFSADDLCILKTMFMVMEKAIDEIVLKDSTNSTKSAVFSGSYIFTLLEKAEITFSKVSALLDILHKVSQYLMSVSESSQLQKTGTGLFKFVDFIEVVFNSLGRNNSVENTDAYYKLYVEPEVSKMATSSSWGSTNFVTRGKVLNFWCFSPGFGMRSLLDTGVRSIILTSGTLSPLSATISEIGIPVAVQLCNNHIIKRNQICATTIGIGPGNTELKCVYANRSNQSYLSDLGQTCLNLFRIIPGGVLVFFPSYPFLKSCVDTWQQSGLWDRLITCKSVFVEPQNKDALKEIVEEYYKTISEKSGASLFAVCRGKISEGMDFADAKARAVIVIGLPYPPFNDPKVSLKRSHLDNSKKKNDSTLDGNEWYQLEAMRAVNQAVGRVIRHAADHGAIIFCDSRFSYPSNMKSLSAWLQTHVQDTKSFGHVIRNISTFFKEWKDYPTERQVTHDANRMSSNLSANIARVTRPAQCLAPTIKKTDTNDFVKLYHGSNVPSSSKDTTTKTSGSLLNSLENFNQSDEIKQIELCQIREGSKALTTSIPAPKKRKLTVVPLNFDSDNSNTGFDPKKYALELQKRLSGDSMKKFRGALERYTSTENFEEFVDTASKVLMTGNKELHSYFREIPYFLKTAEHKEKFWKNYFANNYNKLKE